MKKLVLLVFAVVLTASLSFAKDHDKDSKSGKDKAITGCLSGPNSEGAYQLKTAKGMVEVGGDTQLKEHVGHEVKLTGAWEKSGSAIGENESTEKNETGAKNEKMEKERHFKVSKIDHVSDSCTTK